MDPLETLPGQLDALSRRMDERDNHLRERDAHFKTQFEMGSLRFQALEAGLAENTAATKRIDEKTQKLVESTADLVAFTEAAKGAVKVLNWIGALAKPLGYIVVLIGSVIGAWTAFKTGGRP